MASRRADPCAVHNMALSSSVRKLEVSLPMRLTDLIAPDAIVPSLRAGTKKLVLQELSERAARISGLPPREIFNALLQRERLGSTGTGSGVALPHAKLKKCQRIFGVFARLEKPVDFDAIDGEPVDLVLMLVAPELAGADHLKALRACGPGSARCHDRHQIACDPRSRRALCGPDAGARFPRRLSFFRRGFFYGMDVSPTDLR